VKCRLKIELLDNIIRQLSACQLLPEKNRDHLLAGNYMGYREYHIQSDWLLVYRIDNNVLVLTLSHTGSHSDIFGE
jgi:mRNA interferase YafQ